MTQQATRHRRYLLLLLIAGLLLLLTFHLGFAARYSMAEYGHRPRQSIGTLTGFTNAGAYWYIGSMLVLFAGYGVGGWAANRLSVAGTAVSRRAALLLIALGGLAFSGVLLPLYPVDAPDVYDYIIRGRMSAIYGLNPLEDVPQQVEQDPFYRFASWKRTPSAYGPAWELLAHATSALTHDRSRNTQVIAYKLLAAAGYGLTTLFIVLTLRHIAPQRMVLGMYLFAWNPLVLYMTAGTAHHDAVMTACVAFAVYALVRRWFVLATLGALLGALVKFIPALLLPIIALLALRALGLRRWLRYALLSAVIGGGLAAAFYAPYWHGVDTLRTERRAFMFTGSVWTVARHWLMPMLDGVTDLSAPARQTPISRTLLANGTLLLFGLVYALQFIWLWRDHDPTTPLRVLTRVMLAYLLIAALWFHAWYLIWLVALAALVEDTPLRRLTLIFSYLVTWQHFLYNYMTIQTGAGERLPWLDLVPVLIYMGFAWGYLVLYAGGWVGRWLGSDPHTQAEGRRLVTLRQNAGLFRSDLSDATGIPSDHLTQYEMGLRSMPLDHARRLAHHLGVGVEDLGLSKY